MTRTPAVLLSALTLSICAAVGAPGALATSTCPNEQLRTENNSLMLPECRAYELVSPDANHAALGLGPSGQSAPGGNMMEYQTNDAPDNAESATVFNIVRATRDPAKGWSGVSDAPPLKIPLANYASTQSLGLAPDLLTTIVFTDQPLTSGPLPNGMNAFVGSPSRGFQLMTAARSSGAGSGFSWGNADFSNVYFTPFEPQSASDPEIVNNLYVWSQARGERLVGVRPDGTRGGAALVSGMLNPASEDGKYVLYWENSPESSLYVRIDDAHTIKLGSYNGTPYVGDAAGITPDGSKMLFTSSTEMTVDANTGPAGKGRDLYSRDTASGVITDLTIDTDPADVNGAQVQHVFGVTSDASYIYFTATGDLAAGHTPGGISLYLWHDGVTEFVSNGNGVEASSPSYVTPDGHHFMFSSAQKLTEYNNAGHIEVYEATFGAGVKCLSCRSNGTPPSGDASVPVYTGVPEGKVRTMSDDGSRAFFQSADAVVPQATSGLQQVFEYSDGRVYPISRPDGSASATFLDASASGDDAFFSSYEDLVPNPNGGDQLVFDARVGGGFPVSSREMCSASVCQGAATPPPSLLGAASVTFLGAGNLAGKAASLGARSKVSVSRVGTIKGVSGALKVNVPGKGTLVVSGSGVLAKRSTVSGARTVAVRLVLSADAARALKRKGSFRSRVRVVFADVGGHVSSVSLPVVFKVASAGKGR